MESQDETNEMKKKLKIMTHQIDQFKEEIGNKESALVKVSLQDAMADGAKHIYLSLATNQKFNQLF